MMTLKFRLEKETKTTVRYKEIGDTPYIGTLYIKKSALKKEFEEYPPEIDVEIVPSTG